MTWQGWSRSVSPLMTGTDANSRPALPPPRGRTSGSGSRGHTGKGRGPCQLIGSRGQAGCPETRGKADTRRAERCPPRRRTRVRVELFAKIIARRLPGERAARRITPLFIRAARSRVAAALPREKSGIARKSRFAGIPVIGTRCECGAVRCEPDFGRKMTPWSKRLPKRHRVPPGSARAQARVKSQSSRPILFVCGRPAILVLFFGESLNE